MGLEIIWRNIEKPPILNMHVYYRDGHMFSPKNALKCKYA